MASLICWRRCTKAAALLDIIYSAIVLFTIVGLTAVELSERGKADKSEQLGGSNSTEATTNIPKESRSPQLWKVWAAVATTFAFTFFHFWSSGSLFRGSNLIPAKERRLAIVWIVLKLLLGIAEVVIHIAIFHVYWLAGIGPIVRLLLVLIMIKFCIEIKIIINSQ